MLEIVNVQNNTIAKEIGLQKDDKILEINSETINDQLDYRFYSAEEYIELLVLRNDEQIIFEIEKEYNEDIGIELAEMKMRTCGNNCVFCFVFQNPKGMRKPLYFKDEDYRFSFLYGHYVTLTKVTNEELKRIVDQQLSPLYISVHSTEEETRRILLGIKKDDRLLDKIDFLVKGGIELHTQIVLCPGINDGAILQKTIYDLKQFYPGVKSIAIVPVGLTKHRNKLFQLRLLTQNELRENIEYTNDIRQKIKTEIGTSFVYLSDEFFIKANVPFPVNDYYEDYCQIENGVGEFRYIIDEFNRDFESLPKQIDESIDITWVTGALAADTLEKFIIAKLKSINNLNIELVKIKNNFYGKDITVSGLLVGQDIFNQLKNRDLGDLILLPPKILNEDRLLLDDWTVEMLEQKLNVSCYIYTESISEIINVIRNLRKTA